MGSRSNVAARSTREQSNEYAYPKIPHDYHNSVTHTVFVDGEITISEKLDGSNAKVMVYDDRFADQYNEVIHSYNPSHGDVFFGTKTNFKGRVSDPKRESDGIFNQLITFLRREFDSDAMLAHHNTYDSPLVIFGEYLGYKNAIDYHVDADTTPVYLGFDVMRAAKYRSQPPNPFEQYFEAFLPYTDVETVLDDTGVSLPNTYSRDEVNFTINGTGEETTLSLDVPESEYADVTAEGVIIRNDAYNRRVKYTSPEFEERKEYRWSDIEDACVTGSERFAAKYVTNTRIQKHIVKYVEQHDGGVENVSMDALTRFVLADVWSEELEDVFSINRPMRTDDIVSITRNRCEAVFEAMVSNAERNDSQLGDLWKTFDPMVEALNTETDSVMYESQSTTVFTVSSRDEEILASIDHTESKPVERQLVEKIVSEDEIIETGEAIVRDAEKSFGNWVIPRIGEVYMPEIWYENVQLLANFPTWFIPGKLTNNLMQYISEVITSKTE